MKSLLLIMPYLVLFSATASADKVPRQWDRLTAQEQTLWKQAVAPIYADGFSPEDAFNFYSELAVQSPESSATVPGKIQTRFLELQVARNIASHRIVAAVEEPSTATLKAWAKLHSSSFASAERVDLRSIYIRKFDAETTESARMRAESARAMLDQGGPFAEVALKTSDARSAGLGGSAGTIAKGQISSETARLIFNMPVGELAGPVPRDHGFHIFQVKAKRPAFDFDKAEDQERLRRSWRQSQAAKSLQKLVEDWKGKNELVVNTTPSSVMAWSGDPWLTYGTSSEPFGLVYYSVANADLNTSGSGAWDAFWADEAAMYAPVAVASLACLESTRDMHELSQALKLAVHAQRGMNAIREWYQQQHPTEAQLREFFTSRAEEVYPPRSLYTFLLWQLPVASQPTEEEKGRARFSELELTLNKVYAEIYHNAPQSEREALGLFNRLNDKFPGSSYTRSSTVESVSPLVDPILYRTQPGSLSLPFDNGERVGVVFMIKHTKERATLDKVRNLEVDAWRGQQLSDYVSRIKRRLDIK